MNIGSLNLRQQRLLIAEIGNNHEGDARLALELVDAAAAAGAQYRVAAKMARTRMNFTMHLRANRKFGF